MIFLIIKQEQTRFKKPLQQHALILFLIACYVSKADSCY